jgi:hypothetical protein
MVSRNFTEVVETEMCLEEAIRQGRLTKESTPVSNTKKYGHNFPKKKESEVGMVTQGGFQPRYSNYQHISAITPASQPQMNQTLPPHYPQSYQQMSPQQQYPQQYPQQSYPQQNRSQNFQQPFNRALRYPPFDPIPMKYADLLPALLAKNFVQTRPPPPVPAILPTWYRNDLTCAFHQGAPGHDVERCYALKKAVQDLVRNEVLSFKDENLDVQNNPLPNHNPSFHLIQHCLAANAVLNVRSIKTPLVPVQRKMCEAKMFNHDHSACEVCLSDPHGCSQVQKDIQGLMDKGELLVTKKSEDVCGIVPEFNVADHLEMIYNSGESNIPRLTIRMPGPVLYTSEKAITYRYQATMIQNGVETPIPPLTSVSNVTDSRRILRSGRVIQGAVPQKSNVPTVEKVPVCVPSKPFEREYEDSDEMMKLIKRSEYKIVDQLLQTPSKISMLSLLMNFDAYREALMKVLDQAYVVKDVTLGQFGGIVGNVTACNNLSFSDEELPEKGRNHNLALHVSVACKSDALSNVVVDIGSSLNVIAKTTLDKLSYKDAYLRPSTMIVKVFDGSRKSVIGEVDLSISVGPHEFQVTFQVMNIQASYSCLLGCPWIHEAGVVTSTLHQRLKYVREGKLVIVNGEEALLISHLSNFSYIGADGSDGTSFQGLSLEGKGPNKAETSMASLRDAQRVVREGKTSGWGKVLQLPENKNRSGLGFTQSTRMGKREPFEDVFSSAGFIDTPSEINVVIGDEDEEGPPSFVTPGGIFHN